ncbi:hypothetical protein RFW18_13935 [Metabacillus idriensis]|uniref:hypothetical protein n=1 Tax=Metabacillus idriensis TaxID=324768 RepID=UPI0028147FF1|nr:hypothetical protein [Metabacillus idriensis]MDR0138851.1 hypothetical protein [Metabacillus idriensis]
MNRKVCLLIGDGFTKDFVGKSVNTSKPLNRFENEEISSFYQFFSTNLTDIHNELMALIVDHQLESEFDAIELFVEINKDDDRKECQLRRYLSLAYSSLQRYLDKRDKSNWRWFKWLSENKDEIAFGISFNYDLLLENTLQLTNTPYFRLGSNESDFGIPIIKPHGSIDFDIQQPQHKFVMHQASIAPMIWNSSFTLNQFDSMVQVIPNTHWLLPRLQPDIIPPSQENYQRNLDWVEKGFGVFDKYANEITDLIMIGHSYSACDRPEIDHFLERLNSNALVHIVNPQLLEDLTDKLDNLNLKYRTIVDFETMPW